MPKSKPKTSGKPFYKSKGFWSSVLGVVSTIVPAPIKPIIVVATAVLGAASVTDPNRGPLEVKKPLEELGQSETQ